MNIESLQGRFPVAENPGLDSSDPRFDEIVTLSQDGQHAKAAALSEVLMSEGIYDIRLICFFLFGYWLENGLASILPVLNGLNNVFSQNWQAIGPADNLDTSVEKSLDWLFRQLLKKLQYEENKKSLLWQQWQTEANAINTDEIRAAGEKLCTGINQRHSNKAAPLIAQWSKVENWFVTFGQLAAVAEQEETQGDADSTRNTEVTESSPSDCKHTEKRPDHPMMLTIEASYPMALLLKKLAAFEQMIEENKLPQATLLAQDINHTLATFDPKQYFPKLFEAFVRLQAVNFEALTAHAHHQEDPQWQAMQEWLNVDLDSFIKH